MTSESKDSRARSDAFNKTLERAVGGVMKVVAREKLRIDALRVGSTLYRLLSETEQRGGVVAKRSDWSGDVRRALEEWDAVMALQEKIRSAK